MKRTYYLTIAFLKMTFRNRTNLFFTLFFPLVFILVFGLFNSQKAPTLKIDIISNNKTATIAALYDKIFKKAGSIKTTNLNNLAKATSNLNKGNVDLVIDLQAVKFQNKPPVEPYNTRLLPIVTPRYNVVFYTNKNDQNYSYVLLLIDQIKYSALQQEGLKNQIFTFSQKNVISKGGYSYITFLTPGIVALGIMNGIIFGVITIIINYRELQILRRLFLTPLTKSNFLASLTLSRLVVAIFQAIVLFAVVAGVYNIVPKGSYINLGIVIILGSFMFITLALLLSSLSNSVNTAMPIANIITLPMFFLSGVFFATTSLPSWLAQIAAYLPLTFFVNALRGVYLNGYSLFSIKGDLVGLFVWFLIFFAINLKYFRWD